MKECMLGLGVGKDGAGKGGTRGHPQYRSTDGFMYVFQHLPLAKGRM